MRASRSGGTLASTRTSCLVNGWRKPEGLGVERLAVERGLGPGAVPGAVDGVADDGMADLGHVDADLVRPARLQPAGDERGDRREPLDDPVMRDRALPLVRPARHAPAEVAPVGHEGEVDRAGRRPDAALDDGEVLALDVVGLEQLLKGPHGVGRPGQGERPGGVHVEPVDDADERPGQAVADRQVLARALDQGVALAVGGRAGSGAPAGLSTTRTCRSSCRTLQPGGDVPGLGAVREELDGGVRLDLAAGLVAEVPGDVDPAVAAPRPRRASGEAEPLGDHFIETGHAESGVGGWSGRGRDSTRALD